MSIPNHVPADYNFVHKFTICDHNQHNLLFLGFHLFLEKKLRAIKLLLSTFKCYAHVWEKLVDDLKIQILLFLFRFDLTTIA